MAIETRKQKRRRWRKIKCDQCEILVINNMVCHEQGCPNTPKSKERLRC